jgi:hypothetical protein
MPGASRSTRTLPTPSDHSLPRIHHGLLPLAAAPLPRPVFTGLSLWRTGFFRATSYPPNRLSLLRRVLTLTRYSQFAPLCASPRHSTMCGVAPVAQAPANFDLRKI